MLQQLQVTPPKGKALAFQVNFDLPNHRYKPPDQGPKVTPELLSSSANPFYQELRRGRGKEQQIRLVTIHRASSIDDAICCSLSTESLKRSKSYDALSYTWGDSKDMKPITLNGRHSYVRLNLYTALRRFRSKYRNKTFWIDALCINQDDVRERDSQVTLMADIYQGAKQVRVWLGHSEDDDDDRGVEILKALSKGTKPGSIFKTNATEARLMIRHLRGFLDSPWWERLWVVQELVLGRKATFSYGAQDISFEELLKASKNVSSTMHQPAANAGLADSNLRSVLQDLVDRIDSLRLVYELYRNDLRILNRQNSVSPEPATCINFIRASLMVGDRNASNSRDHIYGLLGMFPTMLVNQIAPTYRNSVATVYIHTAATLLKFSQSLMLFCMQSSLPRAKWLPSWVPDWSAKANGVVDLGLRVAQNSLFDACNSSEELPDLCDDWYLRVKGISFEKIKLLGLEMPRDVKTASSQPLFSDAIQDWEKRRLRYDATYEDDEESRSDLLRTLMADCIPDIKTTLRYRRLSSTEIKQQTTKWLDGLRLSGSEDAGTITSDVRQHISTVSAGKRLFVTESGYVGMGPSDIRVDDDVFVLKSGTHPCVLRANPETEGVHELIGEVYVHGIMDGKVVEGIQPASNPKQWDYVYIG